MMRDPKECKTVQEILEGAVFSEKTAPKEIECNAPATIIMTVDFHFAGQQSMNVAALSKALHGCRETAEMGMLQIGFLRDKIQPAFSYIALAYAANWRWDQVKGFYLVQP